MSSPYANGGWWTPPAKNRSASWGHLPPEQQVDLEVSLLEAKLRTTAEGPEADTIRTAIAALRRLGGKMKHVKYAAAEEKLGDGLVKALTELVKLDADLAEARILPAFHARQRAEIVGRAKAADLSASAALGEYQREAHAEAARLRAKAEAERDPAERLADEMERTRLAASPVDASVLVQQAESMLANGQPKRAAMLLGAVADKGGRVHPELSFAVERALDEAVPERAEAVAIEKSVNENVATFEAARLRALSTALGITSGGDVGNGSPSELSAASVSVKMAEYAKAQVEGRTYEAPSGISTSAPAGIGS